MGNQIRSWRFINIKNTITDAPYWFLIPLGLFIIFRIFLIGLEYYITGGSEFTMDWWNFELGLKPFSVLTFNTDISGYSQPPLYPLIIAPLAIPLSKVCNSFLAPRITYTIFELIGFLMMIAFLAKSYELKNSRKCYILLILCFSPLGFMTGAVMKQEEVVVMVFTVAVLLAWRYGSIKAASILTFLGIISAKILFGIVFIALLLYEKDNREVLIWGLFPSVVFLTIYSAVGRMITGTTPFMDFAPSAVVFCSSFYSLLLRYTALPGSFMKWMSVLSISLSAAVIWIYRKQLLVKDFPLLMAMSFFILYIFFYHINTEYYIFILPLLAYIPFVIKGRRPKILLIILHLVLSAVTWGYGIIYGIRNYAEGTGYRSPSKDYILNLYNKIFGFIQLQTFELILLSATIISIIVLALVVFRLLIRKPAMT